MEMKVKKTQDLVANLEASDPVSIQKTLLETFEIMNEEGSSVLQADQFLQSVFIPRHLSKYL